MERKTVLKCRLSGYGHRAGGMIWNQIHLIPKPALLTTLLYVLVIIANFILIFINGLNYLNKFPLSKYKRRHYNYRLKKSSIRSLTFDRLWLSLEKPSFTAHMYHICQQSILMALKNSAQYIIFILSSRKSGTAFILVYTCIFMPNTAPDSVKDLLTQWKNKWAFSTMI